MGTRGTSTPAADGFRMPAEWEPHAGTWMVWPERPDLWRQRAMPAQDAYQRVAETIAAVEPVTMAASPSEWPYVRQRLDATVRVVEMTSNDAWCRDTGPTFVVNDAGDVAAVDWRFNGWGAPPTGLHFPWDQDELIAAKIAEVEGVDRYAAPIVLEGGSIHVDGEGTLLTTEQCLLHGNRNPGCTRADLEGVLADYLGAERVIWLGAGVVDDETHGHVDNLAFFVRPGVVALTWTDDRADPQHLVSVDARRRLEEATDARGRSLEVVLLPLPGPLSRTEEEAAGLSRRVGAWTRAAGERLAASYANCYVANGRVVVPLLDRRTDEQALDVLGSCFPGRDVVGVPGREILLGGGNVHCITQQVPALGFRRQNRSLSEQI